METDAKGQLGGLTMGEAGRKKLAEMSAAWKCKDCGRSNGEILEECARAAAELGEEGRAEEVVPPELVIGTKEDMDKAKAEREAREKQEEVVSPQAPSPASAVNPYPPASPAQTVPQPTGTATTHYAQPNMAVQQNATIARQRVSSDGVPIWVDRAIGGVVICMVALIMKILLGF